MCEMYSNMKEISIYCDFIDSECFVWWNCNNCIQKINAAAYDMINYYRYTPEEFEKAKGEFKLTEEEAQKVKERMIIMLSEENEETLIF